MTHESAIGHVTGRAVYTDELRMPLGLLRLHPVQAPHAHARILGIDASAALAMPGVHAVLTAGDIPGDNNTGTILHDEPLIPADEVSYHGQAVAWVVAEDAAIAQAAARAVRVAYEALPACLGIDQAIAEQRFHLPPAKVERGEVAQALAGAPHRLQGEVRCGGQDHFYLETHASWVEIDGDGLVQVTSSTQHPSETQAMVAHVLGLHAHQVVCRSLRMGGGFGGKETQANPFAALAALAAWRTGRAVAIQLVRSLDMQLTGKRHPFLGRFDIGFDSDGLLQAMDVDLVADGGWSCDLSPPVLMRAMVHVDNAYYCPHVRVIGRIAKTHTTSHTAFRGFGGPQGVLVGEEVVDRIARHLGLPPHVVRERNFYREGQQPARDTTHYGQPVADNHMADLWAQLMQRSEFARRRQRGRRIQRGADHAQARPGDHADQVRHQLQQDRVQPGRRAGADLPGRLDPAEPRRHRDGAGAAYQDDRGGRAHPRREPRAHPHHGHRHRQGAEHLGHRGQHRLRPQRPGDQGRLRDPAGAPAAGGGADAGLRG